MIEEEMRVIKLFKILSNPTRYKIVKLLSKGSLSSGTIQKKVKKSYSSTSQHLRLLKNLDILQYHMEGKEVIYNLKKIKLIDFIEQLEKYYLRIKNDNATF